MESIFSKDDSANESELEISEVCTPTAVVKQSPSQILESTIEAQDDILDIKRESDSENVHSDSDDNEAEDANINRAASALEDILSNTGEFKKHSSERPVQKEDHHSSGSFTSGILNSKIDASEKNEKKKEAKSKKELEEEEREKMQVLVSNFTEDQLDRYEMYRRSAFPKASIKRIENKITEISKEFLKQSDSIWHKEKAKCGKTCFKKPKERSFCWVVVMGQECQNCFRTLWV
ncbi:uncharacterized protein LOC126260140 isoform X2 [Schistocerca nitens]|uniref:uncharacterized protein LOC126260140 isoform X2 n=1 Tax=Schistocerca nitens TaxID=7011 RepID=UPI002117F98C|nr:uncharacterized protein LOC126260140 isoform X2 [Schistocerca nitens]